MKIRLLRGVNDKTTVLRVYALYTCIYAHNIIYKPSRKRGKIINISEHVKPDFRFPRRQFTPSPSLHDQQSHRRVRGILFYFFFKYPALVPHKRPYINPMALHIPGRAITRPPLPHTSDCCRLFFFAPPSPWPTGPRDGAVCLRRANIYGARKRVCAACISFSRLAPGGNRSRARRKRWLYPPRNAASVYK